LPPESSTIFALRCSVLIFSRSTQWLASLLRVGFDSRKR
jgi:hypothetical protein